MMFPANFLWGAATSAYQIEGDPLAAGAGASIWHQFAHQPGRIANGDTGDVACGHYRRWAEDVALMAELGLTAYRFSVAWGRVLPNGSGAVNQAGLDFYRRLIDALCERGITPMLTLYHWDLPQALQERGGWQHPDSPAWFADYAEVLIRAVDDRVPLWITLNEPWVVTVHGHLEGIHAPGLQNRAATPRVAHHLLLAHAAAMTVYRALGRHQIGLAVNLEPQFPASAAAADQAAAQRRDAFINRWFLDPLLLGSYPPELQEIFGADWPDFPASELARIHGIPDFIGVNYYSRGLVRADATEQSLGARRIKPQNAPCTTMGWEIYPAGLTETLLGLRERYGNVPLYITENGAAFIDADLQAGVINDAARVNYLETHLRAAQMALAQGVDLRGYFVWSLFDNFEWAEGYAQRFGMIHIDSHHGKRTFKRSAHWYREFIQRGGF
ncbi:GH1 family beta-glucosidase [Chromatium okenii]|uniref:GH1 family beta-glucosidase n=1 Tax=Chromatium okenii TaxID=61644 RepID=UPI0026EB52C9|nr:GH1 family beta-glucosidase [Chromatium okenii]